MPLFNPPVLVTENIIEENDVLTIEENNGMVIVKQLLISGIIEIEGRVEIL